MGFSYNSFNIISKMDNSDYLIKLEKRNMILRIISIVILLAIGISILYFRYGYLDPDDSMIIDKIGRNVTCKQALLYYAENEWGLNLESNTTIPIKQLDFSNFSIE